MNNSIIYGTITREIILQNERAVLYVEDEKILPDGTVKKNNWLVVAFKGLAERCKACLAVGSRLVASGSFEARAYKDEYGIDRWTTELYAREIVFTDTVDLEKEKKYFANLSNLKKEGSREQADAPKAEHQDKNKEEGVTESDSTEEEQEVVKEY